MQRKMDGEYGRWRCDTMGTRSRVPEPLSGVRSVSAMCDLPFIASYSCPFTLLILRGLQDQEGTMTLVEGVFFFHRSSPPTARETFLLLPSHALVPSLTSLLVFCSCELVPFASASSAFFSVFWLLLLSAFLLSELSPQERFSSLSSVLLPFCFFFTSALFPPPTSLLSFSLVRS